MAVVKYGYWLKPDKAGGGDKWVGPYQCEDVECRKLFKLIRNDIEFMEVRNGDTLYIWNGKAWFLCDPRSDPFT